MGGVSHELPLIITGGHHFVNTGGNCRNITSGYNLRDMTKDSRRKDPTPEELAVQRREGDALQKIFFARKAEHWRLDGERLSQASLGLHAGMSQGMINHLFSGRRRLTQDQAIRFSDLLGCAIADFSERLANEIQGVASANLGTLDSALAQRLASSDEETKLIVRYVLGETPLDETAPEVSSSIGALVDSIKLQIRHGQRQSLGAMQELTERAEKGSTRNASAAVKPEPLSRRGNRRPR